jgi:hypothetical protein
VTHRGWSRHALWQEVFGESLPAIADASVSVLGVVTKLKAYVVASGKAGAGSAVRNQRVGSTRRSSRTLQVLLTNASTETIISLIDLVDPDPRAFRSFMR